MHILSNIAVVLSLVFSFLFLVIQYMKLITDVRKSFPNGGGTKKLVTSILFTFYVSLYFFMAYFLLKFV